MDDARHSAGCAVQPRGVPLALRGAGLRPVRSTRAGAGHDRGAGPPHRQASTEQAPAPATGPQTRAGQIELDPAPEARHVVARARESARRPGQSTSGSRPARRYPERRREQRVAVAVHGHPAGAGADVRHRLSALRSVQRHDHRPRHRSRHTEPARFSSTASCR